MIQILGLREHGDAFYERGWRANDVEDIYTNYDQILEEIPKEEHWNLFYTVAECATGKREFEKQYHIPFDIDGIDLARVEEYGPLVSRVLDIPFDTMGVMYSGNGIHCMVGSSLPISDKGYFKKERKKYKMLCDKINRELNKNDLPGSADSAVWDGARILRLPGTENRKPNKETRVSRVLQPHIKRHPMLTLNSLLGTPEVEEAAALSKKAVKAFGKSDNNTIMKECAFMQHCRDNQNDIDEPMWYAMLSIAAHMQEPSRVAHELSKEHKDYTPEETDEKLDQASEASGPLLCETIHTKGFDGCKDCPHFQDPKIKSPIQLKSKDHIETEDQGFWFFNSKGQPSKPDYHGLVKYFERKHPYASCSGTIFVYNGTHFEEWDDHKVRNFCLRNMANSETPTLRENFRKLLCDSNLRNENFFDTNGLMNFRNGVLDVSSGVFKPHSPEFGFKYVLPYDYEPSADCERFKLYMKEVTLHDEELEHTLQEFMGVTLANARSNEVQKTLLLTGEGENGKSVFCDTLVELAGKSNHSSVPMSKLDDEQSLETVHGKLFNIAEETPKGSLLKDSSAFKNLITGGWCSIKKVYKPKRMVKMNTKFIFACNDLPKTRDVTHGFYRRLLIIPFNADFENSPKKDLEIRDKIFAELSGVVNYAIEGYKRWVSNKKKFSNSVNANKKLEEYQLENDTVKSWALSYLTPAEIKENGVPLQDIFLRYSDDTKRMNQHPVAVNEFGKRLRRHLGESKFKRIGRRKITTVFGIRLEDFFEGSKI